MKLKVERRWPKATYVIGVLFIDGIRYCETLEDADRGLKQTDHPDYIRARKVPGETQYSLPVGIVSAGFVVDYGEVASVRVMNLAQSMTDASSVFVTRGDFGITFFSGDFTDNCITVQVRPVDTTAGEAVTYRFTWDGADYKGQPTYKMEPGKYYVLHPDTITELEGLFALEFAEWSCGME